LKDQHISEYLFDEKKRERGKGGKGGREYLKIEWWK